MMKRSSFYFYCPRTKYTVVCITLFCLITWIFWYYLTHIGPPISPPFIYRNQKNQTIRPRFQVTENKTYTFCAKAPSPFVPISENRINQIKMEWKHLLTKVEEYPLNEFQGYGIVTSTRAAIVPYLLATLRLLRWLKSTLPVEVFIFPDELNQQQFAQLLTIENVSVHVLDSQQSIQDRKISRYAIKLHAILQSRFEHILWLDADNIPVRDPAYLFDLPHYTDTSAIFWPDFWRGFQNNPIWRILDISCRAEDYEQESGQIIINKKVGWKALHLAKYLSGNADVMKIILGDKDTFRLSWKALNISFHFIRTYLSIGGFYLTNFRNLKDKQFCGHTMVQHDPFGDILFLHANFVKYQQRIKFSPEAKYPQLMNLSNPWRVLRRYVNSTSPYLTATMFGRHGCSCTSFSNDRSTTYEEDFHELVSPNVTMMYLRFLNNTNNNNNDNSTYLSRVD